MITLNEILAEQDDFDVFDVYRPDDPCAASLGHARLRRIYQGKYQIARALQPERICEIGVRAGYAAAAFLAARPRAYYLGIDKEDASHGGVLGYVEYARTMLTQKYPDAWVEIQTWDTGDEKVIDRLQAFRSERFDLVHIDGEHTAEGCFRDMCVGMNLMRRGAYMLVDDYDLIPEVRQGVDRFVCDAASGWQWFHIPSPHGEMLLCKPG